MKKEESTGLSKNEFKIKMDGQSEWVIVTRMELNMLKMLEVGFVEWDEAETKPKKRSFKRIPLAEYNLTVYTECIICKSVSVRFFEMKLNEFCPIPTLSSYPVDFFHEDRDELEFRDRKEFIPACENCKDYLMSIPQEDIASALIKCSIEKSTWYLRPAPRVILTLF